MSSCTIPVDHHPITDQPSSSFTGKQRGISETARGGRGQAAGSSTIHGLSAQARCIPADGGGGRHWHSAARGTLQRGRGGGGGSGGRDQGAVYRTQPGEARRPTESAGKVFRVSRRASPTSELCGASPMLGVLRIRSLSLPPCLDPAQAGGRAVECDSAEIRRGAGARRPPCRHRVGHPAMAPRPPCRLHTAACSRRPLKGGAVATAVAAAPGRRMVGHWPTQRPIRAGRSGPVGIIIGRRRRPPPLCEVALTIAARHRAPATAPYRA